MPNVQKSIGIAGPRPRFLFSFGEYERPSVPSPRQDRRQKLTARGQPHPAIPSEPRSPCTVSTPLAIPEIDARPSLCLSIESIQSGRLLDSRTGTPARSAHSRSLTPSTTLGSPAAHHLLTPRTHSRNLLGSVVAHALVLGSVAAAAQVLPTHSGSATSHPTAHPGQVFLQSPLSQHGFHILGYVHRIDARLTLLLY
jgi:hypothetical protein